MRLAGVIALALAGLASPAMAQSGRGDTCSLNAATPAERRCLSQLVQGQEARLAEVWRRVFAHMGGSRAPAGQSLLAEQRAWIVFKDKACALYFARGLSSLEWTNGMRCRANHLLDRTGQLERIRG